MSDGIGRIGPPDPIAAMMGEEMRLAHARNGVTDRKRRLTWLASLRRARGQTDGWTEAGSIDEELPVPPRAEIANALEVVREQERPPDEALAATAPRFRSTITAEALGRRIVTAADLALRAHARINAAVTRRLIGPPTW